MLDAKKAAEKALQIDDNLAEAHTSLAYYYFRYEWNWPAAEKEFARSIKLDPDYPTARDWYADFLEAMGRTDEAIKQMKKALELDPADITLNADLGLAFCYARQSDEAIKQLSKTLEMDTGADKGRLAQAHNYLGLTYEQQKNFALAGGEYEKAYNLDNSLRFHAIQARGYALSGKVAQAQQILDELSKNKDTPIFYLALLHAALGKPDNIDTAFTLLNKAIENKAPAVAFLKIDPRLDNLRKDHRFEDLLRRVNL
jgi:tetratricopeptide (TPR) repeat protein